MLRILFLVLLTSSAFLGLDNVVSGGQQDGRFKGRPQPKQVKDGSLKLVKMYQRADLDAVTSVAISPDGKFLYASAWQSATHVVFRRDAKTGTLTHVQTVTDKMVLNGATALRLSKDGEFAAAAAFRSSSVVFYSRDGKTGKLARLDVKRQNGPGVTGLGSAMDVDFSPDGRFLYVLDAPGGMTLFRIVGQAKESKLKFIESFRSNFLRGLRGLAIHPSGKVIFGTAQYANALVVLQPYKKTGKVRILQTFEDGKGKVQGLGGAFGVTVSLDGRYVYTTSGRFRGEDAVSVFRYNAVTKKLTLVEKFVRGKKGDNKQNDVLAGFEGGNEIAVSPDRTNVYAVATKSGSVAVFRCHTRLGTLKLVQMFQGGKATAGAAGVTVSPDGKFVYVAAENSDAVSVFRRN